MTENAETKEAVAETIAETVTAEEIVSKEEPEDVDALLTMAIEDNSYRDRARELMARVDAKLGVWVLESPDNWTQGNLLEEIIHYMRWCPDYLFDCPLEMLHKYEMVLASHITYVKSRENHWESMVKIANRDLKRGIKLASYYCKGKSVGEREALAMTKYSQLTDVEKELDMYNIYKDKCKDISNTFTQMDNSLKKTLERRKFEYEHHYQRTQQNNAQQ